MSDFVLVTLMHAAQTKSSKSLLLMEGYFETSFKEVKGEIWQQTSHRCQYCDQEHRQRCDQLIIDPVNIGIIVAGREQRIIKINQKKLFKHLLHSVMEYLHIKNIVDECGYHKQED